MADYKPCSKEVKEGVFRAFDSIPVKAYIDDQTGFLMSPVSVSRVGVQEYFGIELGLEGSEARQTFNVYRPAEEVFCEDSIKSFLNLIVTDGHPKDFVNVENVKTLQKGQLSSVDIINDKVLAGMLSITDKGLISKIGSGKKEVSVGYESILDRTPGIYNNKKYDFVQRQIRANHLAVVDSGRCGSECKILIDEKKESNMPKLKIDGKEFEVEKEVADAFNAMKKGAKKDADKAEAEEEARKEEKKKAEDAKALADSTQAKYDVLKASTKTQDEKLNDAIKTGISEGLEVLRQVDSVFKEGHDFKLTDECGVQDIKMEVIKKIYPDKDFSEKSNDYVSATFDSAIEMIKNEKISKQAKSIADGIMNKKPESGMEAREASRAKYMDEKLGLK